MQIAGICGSLQARSSNLALLERARALLGDKHELVLVDELRHLPLYNPDIDVHGEAVPPSVSRWRRALALADAILIACPEYGHSLPGALKNGVDWVIGSGEFNHKVVAITASVATSERGLRGLAALRTTLLAVDVVLVSDHAVVRGAGADAELGALLDGLTHRAALAAAEPR